MPGRPPGVECLDDHELLVCASDAGLPAVSSLYFRIPRRRADLVRRTTTTGRSAGRPTAR
ncbi:hypothetical protein [Blastococcus sp. SYSU DS0973]